MKLLLTVIVKLLIAIRETGIGEYNEDESNVNFVFNNNIIVNMTNNP